MIENDTSEKLLQAYLSIWNNRSVQPVHQQDKEGTLSELIRRELLDENTHPRLRKSVFEKFYYSMKRLAESDLSTDKIHALTIVYLSEMEQLT
ncbi:hypothetical protein MHI18_03960 [Peribacillus sp. FSL H8-0477]|uniref:hypothetical protein n=1 Tax=Peribacillus sp. FSL H8-0477 TaxID=2921388 RepID=UPI0030F9F41F